VLKLYTAAWLPWLPELLDLICAKLQPSRIVLRLSRNAQEFAKARFGKNDGQVVFGADLDRPVNFLETGLRFEADVCRGQKTGFFLDQRDNRRRLETLAGGKTVLNAFSFSGGFSIYAARGCARSVLDLDISPHALAAAERNFALNRSDPTVGQCSHDAIQADAFEWLAGNSGRKFDLVVLDPPSLAKREAERAGAIAAYGKLISLATQHINNRGILLACSCSAHVSEDEFFQIVLSSAPKSHRKCQELARTRQPPDHAAKFDEGKYLKAIYLRVT
jgi:23S rRNA (cytosine1962-C5)-methyltransferase